MGKMALTMLGRTAARCAAARMVATTRSTSLTPVVLKRIGGARSFGGYDWNLGVPGSKIRNPDPQGYDDVYPGMGTGWWTLISLAIFSFFWTNWYDTSRGVVVAIGIFGPNMPL